jgi:hypothetical protein
VKDAEASLGDLFGLFFPGDTVVSRKSEPLVTGGSEYLWRVCGFDDPDVFAGGPKTWAVRAGRFYKDRPSEGELLGAVYLAKSGVV